MHMRNVSGGNYLLIDDWKQHELRRAYAAVVSFLDAQLGRVLDALDASPFANNTIIVMWGDHGYQVGEHGLWGKMTNFELATRVPLLLSVPGQPQGIRSSALVEFVDVFPTLVDAAMGIEHAPKGLEGKSMMPLFKDPRAAFNSHAFSQYQRQVGNQTLMGMSMRVDEWRFTAWVDFNYTTAEPIFPPTASQVPGGVELYAHFHDRESDFDEFENANLADSARTHVIVEALYRELVATWPHAQPFE